MVPGAAVQTMDGDLSNVRRCNYSMLGHYRRNCFNDRKHHNKVESTSNTLTEDSLCAVGSKKRIRVAEDIFGVHTTKPSPIMIPTAGPN